MPFFIDRKPIIRTPKPYSPLAYLPYIYARFYNGLIIRHNEVASKLAYFGPREENFGTTAKMNAENGKLFGHQKPYPIGPIGLIGTISPINLR
jgi:hypothetical protein